MKSRSIVASLLFAALTAGCAAPPRVLAGCPATAGASDAKRVPVALDLRTVAGDKPFTLGATARSQSGVRYQVTKLAFYLSESALVDARGATVRAPLAGPDGRALPYGVALVDYARPESLKLSVLAPPGQYRALNLMVGVPDSCASGEPLAHGDAAARVAPLDVDSDMYWSWSTTYTSLKIEGRLLDDDRWEPFVYHVGEDARRARLHIHVPLEVSADASNAAGLVIDVNRLFVSPAGGEAPPLEAERVHSGPLADQMAMNIAKSGFVTVGK